MGKNEEKLLEELAKDLEFCELSLRKEARIDFIINVLDEILLRIEGLDLDRLPRNLHSRASQIASRARILYHRAVALSELKEKEAMEE